MSVRSLTRTIAAAAVTGLLVAAPLAGTAAAQPGGGHGSPRHCIAKVRSAISRIERLAVKVEHRAHLEAEHAADLLDDFRVDVAALVAAKEAIAAATSPEALAAACRSGRAEAHGRWRLAVKKTRMVLQAEKLADRIERLEGLLADLADEEGASAASLESLEAILADAAAELDAVFASVLDLEYADLTTGEAREQLVAAHRALKDLRAALGRAHDAIADLLDGLQ